MRTVNKHTYDCDVSKATRTRARDEMMDAVTRPNERTNVKGPGSGVDGQTEGHGQRQTKTTANIQLMTGGCALGLAWAYDDVKLSLK